MFFNEMVASVVDDCRLNANDTTEVARVKRFLNEGHSHILRRPNFSNLRNGTLGFTSEVNRNSYGFVQAMSRVDKVTQISNDRYLNARSLDWLRQIDPGQRMTGTPTDWVDMGWQPVFRHPVSTGVWAVSTAADTTQTVRIRGVRATGDVLPAVSALLTGAVRVQLGTVTDYTWIESFTMTTPATGYVSLYDAAVAGNELARLPIGTRANRWKIGRLWPTPSAALSYVVDGQLQIYTLVDNDDVPMLPEEYHDMLPCYARRRQARWIADPVRFKLENDEWLEWIGRLNSFAEFPQGYRPTVAGRGLVTGWNNLGGWYPADGWGN